MKFLLVLSIYIGAYAQDSPAISGCEKDKFCFLIPKGCGDSGNVASCTAGMTAKKISPTEMEYQLIVKKPTEYSFFFISMGLSEDIWMGDDSVVSCLFNSANHQAQVELSYNLGHSNAPLDDQSPITLTSSTGVNGVFTCSFKVLSSTTNPKIFDVTKPYYILLTKGQAGPVNDKTMEKYVHGFDDDDNFPFVSHGKHILVKPDFGYGDHGWASQVSRTTQAKLVQVHGSLFVTGIWIFMSIGYFFSAFYKRLWDEKVQLGGKAAWFQIHRILMSLGLLCFVVGFICVFVACGHLVGDLYVPGKEKQLRQHAIMGITAVILVILQPIGALLRCDKNSPYRPFFRFGHSLGAATIYGLAHGCIFYATSPGFTRHKASLDTYNDLSYNITTTFMGVHGAMIVIGWLLIMALEAKNRSNDPESISFAKLGDSTTDLQSHFNISPRVWAWLLYLITFVSAGTYIGLTGVMINMIVNVNPNYDPNA